MALLLLVPGQTCANAVDELTEIQAQVILTEVKVRPTVTQQQLGGKGETGQIVSAQGQTFTIPVPVASSTITRPVPPVARTIYGVDGKIATAFLFPGGYEVDAVNGTGLPGNYRVKLISLDQIVFTDKGDNHVPVGFSSVAPAQTASSARGASAPPALPGAVPRPSIRQVPS